MKTTLLTCVCTCKGALKEENPRVTVMNLGFDGHKHYFVLEFWSTTSMQRHARLEHMRVLVGAYVASLWGQRH